MARLTALRPGLYTWRLVEVQRTMRQRSDASLLMLSGSQWCPSGAERTRTFYVGGSLYPSPLLTPQHTLPLEGVVKSPLL